MARKFRSIRSQGLARRWATNILSVVAATVVAMEIIFIFLVEDNQ